MANFNGLKAKKKGHSSLGAPPKPEEAGDLLASPEVAPEAAPVVEAADVAEKKPVRRVRRVVSGGGRVDGRSLRRTNRSVQLATRVTPEFSDEIRRLAARDGKLLVEILEEGLSLYEKKYKD